MYKRQGLTQENSVYDLSLLGDTNNNTGATDFSNMSDEEILKAFEEKQNSENADNKDNTETLSDTKTETTENTTDKTDKVADLDLSLIHISRLRKNLTSFNFVSLNTTK